MSISVDPRSFDMQADFRYDRKAVTGQWVEAVVLACAKHVKEENGSISLKLTFGAQGPEGGFRVDTYVPLMGPKFKEAVMALAPEVAGGGTFNPPDLNGRWAYIWCEEEWNAHFGANRPRVGNKESSGIAPIKTAAPAAPAQPAPATQTPSGAPALDL